MRRIDSSAVTPSTRAITMTPTVARSTASAPFNSLCSACVGMRRIDESGRCTWLRYRYLRTLACRLNDAPVDRRTSCDRRQPPLYRATRLSRRWRARRAHGERVGGACLVSYRDFLRVPWFVGVVDAETKQP